MDFEGLRKCEKDKKKVVVVWRLAWDAENIFPGGGKKKV
jgi:hypothetical protein